MFVKMVLQEKIVILIPKCLALLLVEEGWLIRQLLEMSGNLS